ncbi:helix-turn-helix domain-containing protein [Streptomyces sp. NPDC088736]|uniref:helix-turn-helix domain-containing protein n=1 Tax=Streptomyces sp. NPDC088736 TaxID=3365881 RepID=UPI003810DF37
MPLDPLPAWVLTRRRAIGDRVRAAREARGLTQEELAELIDRDRKTVNRIEQGTLGSKVDDLILIAAALDTPLADLVR